MILETVILRVRSEWQCVCTYILLWTWSNNKWNVQSVSNIPSSPIYKLKKLKNSDLKWPTLFSQYFSSCQTSSFWAVPFHVTRFSLVNERERISSRGLTCMVLGIRGRSTSLLKNKLHISEYINKKTCSVFLHTSFRTSSFAKLHSWEHQENLQFSAH